MTLVFTTTGSWISSVIKWFTGSKASHVAIGLELHGVPLLLHSDVGGVQVSLRSRFVEGNRVVAEYECLTIPEDNLAGAERDLGERYDYVGLFGYAFVIAARWLGKKIKNPLASPRAVVCSEFVLSLDPDGLHVPTWKGFDPERTTPQDLIEACERDSTLFRKL